MSIKNKIRNLIPKNVWEFISPIYYSAIRPWYDKILGPLYYKIEITICNFRFQKNINLNPYDVPIIINNFNRLTFLELLIKSLEERGYYNIYIIDNKSTYPKLIDYYDRHCKYPIFRLNENLGFKAIWKSGIYDKFKHSYYVYTDSDMQIDEECPKDFMDKFISILNKYSNCYKVGFGLRIDDIPNSYKFKTKVLEQEKRFWVNEISPGIYSAPIDTTFALYKPYTKGPANELKFNIRTGFPYIVKHLPWYSNSEHPSEEELYYINNTKTSTYWTKKIKDEEMSDNI